MSHKPFYKLKKKTFYKCHFPLFQPNCRDGMLDRMDDTEVIYCKTNRSGSRMNQHYYQIYLPPISRYKATLNMPFLCTPLTPNSRSGFTFGLFLITIINVISSLQPQVPGCLLSNNSTNFPLVLLMVKIHFHDTYHPFNLLHSFLIFTAFIKSLAYFLNLHLQLQ